MKKISILYVILTVLFATGAITSFAFAISRVSQQEMEQKSISQTADTQLAENEMAITRALAARHSRPASEISVTIERQTDGFARGIVMFAPGGPGNTGIFFAANSGGKWQIIHDGNGLFPCSDASGYDLPDYMANSCYHG